MKLPMFKRCECDHLGAQHNDDGTCARCSCEKFKRPSRTYVRAGGVVVAQEFRPRPKSKGAGPERGA